MKPPEPVSPSRLRRWAAECGVVAAGVLLGLATAWWAVRPAGGAGPASGPWRASTLAGSAEADPWTRARVALGGLLALNREETMYYVATVDSAGQPLRTRCRYVVTGTPPAARWWSVTAYADDHFLVPHEGRRHSVNGSTVALDAQGRFRFAVGATAPDEALPWLPTPVDRGLVLTLRVYHPAAALQADPGALAAPRIERVGACT